MQQLGANSVKAGKVEGVALSIMWEQIHRMIEMHPRGLEEIATVDEVMDAIKHQQLDVWASGNESGELKLIALTQTSMFRKGSTLFVMWIGGKEFKEYAPPLLEAAERYCALHGIKSISASGSRALGRVLGSIGFSCPRHEYTKSIGFVMTGNSELARKN